MTSTIDPARTDRNSLRLIVAAFALAVSWVVVQGALQWWDAASRGVVTIELRPPFDAAVSTAPSGAAQQPVDVLRLEVSTADLGASAVGWLRMSDVLSLATWVALFVLAALLLRRIARGRLFDQGFHRLLNAVSIAILCVVVLPNIASVIGTDIAITELGYGAAGEPGDRPSAAASSAAWIAFLAALFVSGLQVAFRGASRLARDQEGVI